MKAKLICSCHMTGLSVLYVINLAIHLYGDSKGLLQKKKHFTNDIKSGRLGSQPHKYVLEKL